MFRNNSWMLALVAICALALWSCGGSESSTSGGSDSGNAEFSTRNSVVLHALSDPKQLNPVNSSDNTATVIQYHVFQYLVHINYDTYEMEPVLAAKVPEVKEEGGKLIIDWEIREGAKWDNGEQITGKDVAFSLKTIKAPKTDCAHLKPYLELVQEVIIDKDNPRKFTTVCDVYFLATAAFMDLPILPAYVYDPDGLLEEFTVKQLTEDADKLANNNILNEFAEQFNSPKYQRETIVGSGPYAFDRWDVKQRVVLKKKKDWWGEKYADANHHFTNSPDELVYETINDWSSAVVSLKNEELDCMQSIRAKDFVDLKGSESFKEKFNPHTPPIFAYTYFGLNTRHKILKDKKVRKALAHTMDVDQFISTTAYGLGERVASIIHPIKEKLYNKDLKLYDHNLETAKALLAEAGWKDTDGDKILDKMIDGKKTDFSFEINFNTGNTARETACLIFQEKARNIGIDIKVVGKDWSVFLEDVKNKDFDAMILSWISSPLESDPSQIWHTNSIADGSNYVGFGSPKSDKIIDKLRKEMDFDKRAVLYKELQAEIHEEVPYIFLSASKNRIAIHKRFPEAKASGMRPGYWAANFVVSRPVAQ